MSRRFQILSAFAALALAAVAPRAAAQVDPVPQLDNWGSSEPAGAKPAGRAVGFLLRMGLDFGGDELVKVSFENGDTQSLKAGGLFSLAAGFLYHPAAPWALEATIGYKVDDVSASNGKFQFSRWPVDVVASFVASNLRVGAGPTFHLSPTFKCDMDGLCNDEAKLDNAVGGIVQIAYGARAGVSSGWDLGVRYTFIKYGVAGVSEKADGSSFGLFVGGWL